MAIHSRAAATAKKLIEKNGREVTFQKLNRTPADSTKPWRGPDVTTDPDAGGGGDSVTAKAVFVPARGTGFGRDARDKSETMLKDIQQFALVASDSMPAETDLSEFQLLRDGDHVYRIHSVGELKPGDTSVVWEIGVGK